MVLTSLVCLGHSICFRCREKAQSGGISRICCVVLCRYNLKRKIANLPPVTREWFEARKEKLVSTTGTAVTKIWLDPLTKKKFGSENTYKAYVNSKKYKDLVKQSGKPAPEPAVSLRRAEPPGAHNAANKKLLLSWSHL
jgi:hypothetical protein